MKRYLIVFLAAAFAITGYAFSEKKAPRFDPPATGYFVFDASDPANLDDPDHYSYHGQMPPGSDCNSTGLICTILSDLDDRSSNDPEDWKPDFSVINPVDDEGSYTYISKDVP